MIHLNIIDERRRTELMGIKAKSDIDFPKERVKRKRFLRPTNFDPNVAGNPFITPVFRIPVTEVIANAGLFKVDKQGNIVSAEEVVYKEQHKYVKMYTDVTFDNEDEDGNRVTLNRTETPSLRKEKAALTLKTGHLLLWIAEKLEVGQDYIFINKEAYLEESGVGSINTYKAALKELIDKRFITPASTRDTYWINPMYMFKGSRTEKYRQNLDVRYGKERSTKGE